MSDSNYPISALNYLPQDLIEEILPFLPAKSLGRFKSVSKRWYSLISSPEFIKTHIQKFTGNNPNPNPTHLILVPRKSEYSHYSLDMRQINTQTIPATVTAKPLKDLTTHDIYGSCNGLLLAKDKDNNLWLVNLTTRKTLKVPNPGGETCFESYVFGYDLSTDDYNVISIFYMDCAPRSVFARVYSLRNNSWNNFPNIPYEKHDFYGPWLLLNNNLHWLTSIRPTMTIAAYSVAGEHFHEIDFPDSVYYDKAWCGQLCVLGGKLVVVMCDDFEYELWVMEEYWVPKSWTKLCTIEHFISPYFEVIAQVRVNNQDILLGISHKGEIYIYNIDERNMDERRFTSVTVEGCQEKFMVFDTYVESLESFERFR